MTFPIKSCGHVRWFPGTTCRMCGTEYCRNCGSPQVVTVRKTEHKAFPGGYTSTQREVKEVWPLCHACAAKMPPVWVEPTPPPPVSITVSNKTNQVDWTEAIKLLDALKLPTYACFPKEPARGTAHQWDGVNRVRAKIGLPPLGEESAPPGAKENPSKPPKPKKTPQSVLEADVQKFLREQDDD